MSMQKRPIYTFREYLAESLQDPEFKKEWDALEVEHTLSIKLIEARLKKKMSQRQLADKIHTSQAAISRIEAMNGNPSVALLKRIAAGLDTKLQISFVE
jgi:ribosome-binding protein aMBF1 (putative translation factor)